MKNRILALAAASLFAVGFGQALAQYPPPIGNIVLQPTNPNPAVNQDAPLVVTVQSEAGVAAGYAACSASLASQPGIDANVSPTNFSTNGSGNATLTVYTGSTVGQIQVVVNCGALYALASLEVQGAAAPSDAPRPPNTGTGARAGDSQSNSSVLWTLVAIATLAAVTGLAARRRFRHN